VTLTEAFGSLGRALRFVEGRKDIAEVERSREARIADLEVYLALNQFAAGGEDGSRSIGAAGAAGGVPRAIRGGPVTAPRSRHCGRRCVGGSVLAPDGRMRASTEAIEPDWA